MSLFQHKNGYYGYNFMYKGDRQCHTFKGLSKDEVATKEMEHKLALKKNIPYTIDTPKEPVWEDGVEDFKRHAEGHYTRPTECMYVIDEFSKIVKGMYLKDIKLKHFEEYITKRKGVVKASSINRELTSEEIKMLGKGYSKYTGRVKLENINLRRSERRLKGDKLLLFPHAEDKLTVALNAKSIKFSAFLSI